MGHNELALFTSTPPKGFPLLSVAIGIYKRCGSCSHANMAPMDALSIAVQRYRHNPAFLDFCETLFKLPATVASFNLRR
jgi:hypothetical protein